MTPSSVLRIDVFAALSLATDFALGQPQEFALRSARFAVRLAHADGANAAAVSAVLYQSLLRYVGCNADTFLMSALLGDEYAVRRDFAEIDSGRPGEVIGVVLQALRRRHAGASAAAMIVAIAQGLARAPSASRAILTGHCEVAERIAARLGLAPDLQGNLRQLYERWDGTGLPAGLKGEAVAYPVRVVSLAQDALVLVDAFGRDRAAALIAKRSGGAYDPKLATLALRYFTDLLEGLDAPVDAVALRALEPQPQILLSDDAIDAACLVMADMADMRMPHTLGHSRGVAELSEATARLMRLPEPDILCVRRAGLVHDIGEVVLPVSVWARPGALAGAEWDQARLHPYHSERIVARAGGALVEVAAVAGRHHERLNGSGYFRGCRAADLTPASRILAVAEAWRGWVEPRPYRPAQRAEAATARINQGVREGLFCPIAAAALLEAAGQRSNKAQRNQIADLTPREIEVLRLIAAGQTAKEVARNLTMAPKTAGNHLQNIYAKLGVTTRAAAVLFAVEHGIAGAGDRLG